jgi:hypothetical protein
MARENNIIVGTRCNTEISFALPGIEYSMRPRQVYNDCVVACFQELTGEPESMARAGFTPFLDGSSGVRMEALAACLKQVGWRMYQDADFLRLFTSKDKSIAIDDPDLLEFWRNFQGQGVLHYRLSHQPIGHVVVVRSGGIILDPAADAPEEGESLVEHFKRRRLINPILFPLERVEKVS